MNAIRVSKRAWRKPGIPMMIILLGLIALQRGKAADINITITGVLTGGWDRMGIFFTGKEAQNLGGKPFTLVYTFDDAKGNPKSMNGCANGMGSAGTPSAGKAVLTMGNASYTFGDADKYSESGIFRDCRGTDLRIFVTEKKGSYFNEAPTINMEITPENGKALPAGADWRSPASMTAVDSRSSCFIILKKMNSTEVRGCLDIKKVEISAGK